MDLQEHTFKEILKHIVDNSPNYTERMRFDLKAIIDTAKSQEELAQAILAYFATFRW